VSTAVQSTTFSSFDDKLDRTTAMKAQPRKSIQFKPSEKSQHWASPSPKAAFHDGVTSQTIIQSAMVRERSFITSKSTRPYHGTTIVGPKENKYSNTIWGSIRNKSNPAPEKDTHKGLRPEVLKSFNECFDDIGTTEPSYAIGHQSSVSFHNKDTSPSESTKEFIPQAYKKHLGIEPLNPPTSGPAIMVSDRAPDSVVERRRRRDLHKHIISLPNQKIPFNRKALQGSLSDYAEERMILSKLTGECHPDGDPRDIGPPRVKLWLDPNDNEHITYVKSDPRFGIHNNHYNNKMNKMTKSSKSNKSSHTDDDFFLTTDDANDSFPDKINYDQVRPRTVGYSPGHIRSVRNGSFSPIMSSTARRIQYCNDLHHAQANDHVHGGVSSDQNQSKGKLSGGFKKSGSSSKQNQSNNLLSNEVEVGIGIFEERLNEMKAKGWKGV